MKEISLNARETIKNFSEDGRKDIEIVFYRVVRRLNLDEKKSFSFSDKEEAILGSELKGLNLDFTVVYCDVYYYDN